METSAAVVAASAAAKREGREEVSTKARQLKSEKVLAESQIMSFNKTLISIEVPQEINEHSGTRWRLAYKHNCL